MCAYPVVSPRTTRTPAPRSRPGAQLLDLAVVEGRARAIRRSSANTSAKSPPLAQGTVAACVAGRTLRSRHASEVLPTARGAYRTPMPLEPGLVGSADAHRQRRATPRSYLGSGDVPVLATPRVVLARRGGDRAARSTATLDDGQHDRRLPGAARPPRPGPGRRRGARRGRPRDGRGPPAHVPGLGEARRRPRRRRPHHPGRRRALPLPRESRRRRPDPPVPSAAWATPGTPSTAPTRLRAGPRTARLGGPEPAAAAIRARADPASPRRATAPAPAAPHHPSPSPPRSRQPQPPWGTPPPTWGAPPPGGPVPPGGAGGGWQPPGPPVKKRRLTWLWILIPVLVVFVASAVVVGVFAVRLAVEPIDATNDYFARRPRRAVRRGVRQRCARSRRRSARRTRSSVSSSSTTSWDRSTASTSTASSSRMTTRAS